MFHVKHAPVQKSPADPRATLDQLLHSRVDYLYGKGGGQVADGTALPIDMNLQASARATNSKTVANTILLTLPKDGECPRAALDQQIGLTGSKRPPSAQEVDSFEDTRLARGVWPGDDISLWVRRKFDGLQAAKRFDPELLEAQWTGISDLRAALALQRIGCPLSPVRE